MKLETVITAEQLRDELRVLERMTLPEKDMAEQMHFLACLRPPSLWEFATEIYGPAVGLTTWGALHKELGDFTERAGRLALVMLSRGHLKSTFLTICGSLRQALYHYPRPEAWESAGGTVRQAPAPAIVSHNLELSGDFVQKIKAACETRAMRERFPTVIPATQSAAPGPWNSTCLTFMNGTSITAFTGVKPPTGRHTGHLFADDLVTRETVNTSELIANTREVFGQLLSILNPEGEFWLIGTCYHHLDLYADVRKSANWDKFIRPCFNEDGTLSYPEKFTRESLKTIEDEQDPYTFSCQYLLQPVPMDEQVFRPEWMRMDAPERGQGGTITLTVDPAISQKESACDTAITVVESVRQGEDVHRYLRHRVRRRMNPSEIVEAALSLAELYGAHEIGIEAIQYQAAIEHYMTIEMRKRGRYFTVTPIKSYSGRSKYDRIKGLQPEFSRGRYHLRKGEHEDVVEELISFPQGSRVDVIDSMAMHNELDAYKSPQEADRDFLGWYESADSGVSEAGASWR